MDGPLQKAGKHHGLGDPALSRYGALHLGLACWIALGVALFSMAVWPSTCTPADVIEAFTCSPRLPESGRWVESALLTWLWSSPILALLEISRRIEKREERVEP